MTRKVTKPKWSCLKARESLRRCSTIFRILLSIRTRFMILEWTKPSTRRLVNVFKIVRVLSEVAKESLRLSKNWKRKVIFSCKRTIASRSVLKNLNNNLEPKNKLLSRLSKKLKKLNQKPR